MNLFDNHAYHHHEEIHYFYDKYTGLQALIAIHRLIQGRAGGGCRFYPYMSSQDALTDVLRLSKAMTYKFVLANIPYGGAKSVIIGDPQQIKTPELLAAFGERVNGLRGKYLAGPDVGTNADDMGIIRTQTKHVTGNDARGGSTAPLTAYGVFKAIEGAWDVQAKGDNLEGVKVAIQGFGGVGFHLASLLKRAGADICIADVNPAAQEKARSMGVKVVHTEEILFQKVDILSPCALGGIINLQTVNDIQAKIICGGANNQLEGDGIAKTLNQKGIIFVPDFVASVGGAIQGTGSMGGRSPEEIKKHADGIYDTTRHILKIAVDEQSTPLAIAYRLAEEKLEKVG